MTHIARRARVDAHRGRAAVQREGHGRGRGGDRLAAARTVPRRRYGEELRPTCLLLADAGNWSVGTPGLTYSLRGLAGGDVRLRGLESPLHSGMAGGAVPDPVMALAGMLASLVDEHGDPAFDGCWDDWSPTHRPRSEHASRRSRKPTTCCAPRGDCSPASQLSGDPSVSVYERLWHRPAITVIGIDGHPIKGSSNQIVTEAAARISIRVATGQDPQRLNAALQRPPRPSGAVWARVRVHAERSHARLALRARRPGVHGDRDRAAGRVRRRPRVHGRRRHDPVRRPVRRSVRRHPRAAARPRRPRQPHPRRGREPPPRRLAQAHRSRNPPPRSLTGFVDWSNLASCAARL